MFHTFQVNMQGFVNYLSESIEHDKSITTFHLDFFDDVVLAFFFIKWSLFSDAEDEDEFVLAVETVDPALRMGPKRKRSQIISLGAAIRLVLCTNL